MANVHPGDADAASAPPASADAPWGVCALCHGPLIRPGSVGGCTRCIVRFVGPDEDDSLFFAGGGSEEISGYAHFEIARREDGSLDELGHGTMGTTFRAVDTVLRTPVALKVIGRNVADSPLVRTRFLREARVAARLRHPNVASVFHYGEQQGECFYVMELVEGETLEARVRREGPMSASAALELTVQISHALAAAEAQGQVHRDLKPSNVMLSTSRPERADGTPLVKVIDFGLAKAVTPEGDVPGMGDTRGGFVGTPAFASPEQFARAEDESIDTRSDIYSLGVTLWYLLCGKVPFVGKTLTEVHEQQARLPLGQLRAARVPAPVVVLLRSMLAVAPMDRPQNVRELLDALHRCQRRLLTTSRNRYVRLAGASALLASLVLGIALWREHTRPPVPPADRSVAVLPFENLSPEAGDAFFTTGIQDEITNDLAHLSGLTVINPRSTREYQPGKPRDLPEIGRQFGVTQVLEGRCRREGERMRIELRLNNLNDPAQPWTQQYDRRLADIFAVQGEIARAVADHLQLFLSPSEKATMNRPPTSDLVAYELYLRSNEGPDILPDMAAVRRNAERSIALLDQAVARDPNFTLAYCRLVLFHDNIWPNLDGATPEELSVDHRTLAEIALQKARSLQPDAGEVHLAVARHLGQIDDTSGQILVEVDLARRLLPNSAAVERLAAGVYADYGRWEDAIRAYQRCIVLDPRYSSSRPELAWTYAELRRYEDYDRTMAEALPLVPAATRGEFRLQRARGPVEARADLTPLRVALAEISDAEDPDGSARMQYGLIVKLCEHDPDGVQRLLTADQEPLVWYARLPYPKPWFEALAARMRGDGPGAQVAFAAARTAMEKLVAEKPSSGQRLSILAMIDAGLGRRDDAVREARRACEMLPYETCAEDAAVPRCNLAVVYAWTGQPDLAFATLSEAVDHAAGECLLFQPTYGDLQLDPVWDSIRGDPRFAALVAKLAPKPAR